MKKNIRKIAAIIICGTAALTQTVVLSACSNLFENIFNEDGSQKTGDDSLLPRDSSNTDITSGLVVIKNTDRSHNQITYDESQKIYFVGSVPDSYNDFTADYTNGSRQTLVGKDDPLEFRCFVNDSHAKVTWTAVQTWAYTAGQTVEKTSDSEGNEVVYKRLISQTAEKLAGEKEVSLVKVNVEGADAVEADLPYGVTVVTCSVLSDDGAYKSEYTIVLTKKYTINVADSSNASNVTDHGLVVIKQTAPDRNAIEYSSTTYEYEVGDSSGVDTSLDLTGRDDPIVIKCYLLDEDAELDWSVRWIKKYVPLWDSDSSDGGVVDQSLVTLDSPVDFDFVKKDESYTKANPFMRYLGESNEILSSDLPYGVTEVCARITAYNEDVNGELVPYVNEYKITLTKRYIITTASSTSKTETEESGLLVLANGKTGNLINYKADTLSYEVETLTGANDPERIIFYPEEADFTKVSWRAVQVEDYTAVLHEYTNGDVTYIYQSGGTFTKLSEEVDLLAKGILSLNEENGKFSLCSGNLPYGKSIVYVTVTSLADSNSKTCYEIILKKKRVTTSVNIVSSEGDLSTVTDKGLVVLSSDDDYSLNHISYKTDTLEYPLTVSAKDNGNDGMKFRCYLADSEANITWSVTQVKEFSLLTETKSETDDITGETIIQTYPVGQSESECSVNVDFTKSKDDESNEICAMIPYGVTEVTALIDSVEGKSTCYKIILTRNLFEEGSTQGSYSLLKSLAVSVKSGEKTEEVSLVPAFDPLTSTYTLTVDEEADEISLAAVAQSLDAEISDMNVITKYGEVPGVEGMTASLVGGKSRISFSVTDETSISRTYSIYVEKPADGDTTLSQLTFTPQEGFENGVKAFDFDSTYKGGAADDEAKYSMTLSADSRVDVNKVTFTAIPANKRTTVCYAIGSEKDCPSDWSTSFTKAMQKTSPLSKDVDMTDTDSVETLEKVLWIKTVSDEYYHHTKSGYEEEKRSDTSYHKVKIVKAGKTNKNLTALVVVATYENDKTSEIIRQLTAEKVAYTTEGKTVDVTTFADKLDFYFRPLNKDATVSYTAKNTAYKNSIENTSFNGYSENETDLKKITEESSVLSDGSNEYYTFSLGQVQGGTASSLDLPNGTTTVTICGVTYNFTKPDLSTVSYDVKAKNATGSDGVYEAWTEYIYLDNTVTSLKLDLTTKQQNENITIKSCTQTYGSNGVSLEDGDKVNAGCSLHHYKTSEGENIVKWLLLVGNAADSVTNYSKTQTWNTLATEIPVGTTKLEFRVSNEGTGGSSYQDYTYYIIRASDSESRLNALSFGKQSESLSQFQTDWTTGMTENSYFYLAKNSDSAYGVDEEGLTLKVQSVSEKANILVTKKHTNEVNVAASSEGITNATWSEGITFAEGTYSVSKSFDMTEDDAGTLCFTITVTSQDNTSVHTYYLLVYVEADKTVRLESLSIIQKGSETADLSDDSNRTILKNSFDSEKYTYTNLYASLNCTGDIVITPQVYKKASITQTSLTFADGTSLDESDYSVDENNAITLPYSFYISKLGSSFTASYKVRAQDESVTPLTYSATFSIPSYTTITEHTTYRLSSTYEYQAPTHMDNALAYRFNSLIADESSFLKGLFGGIDILGSSSATCTEPVWYESSFASSGLQFFVEADGIQYGVKLGETGVSEKFYTYNLSAKEVSECSLEEGNIPNLTLTVTPEFVYEDETPYLSLTLTLEKPSGAKVKLGAAIDTLVGTLDQATLAANDSVNVEETNNGFTMNGNEYSFVFILKNAFGVDDVDTLWYGPYNGGSFIESIFDSSSQSGLSEEGQDSAATFSWTLGSENTYEKKIRFTMKSLAANEEK